jgi:hypothetical protein
MIQGDIQDGQKRCIKNQWNILNNAPVTNSLQQLFPVGHLFEYVAVLSGHFIIIYFLRLCVIFIV